MSAPLALDWNVEGKSCGFWVRQADSCSQSIHVGTVIVAALSAIVVLGGVLLILAQQGYHLGAINSLTKLIHPTWVYTGVAVAGVVFALDTAFICMLVRGYTNQVYSKEKLDQMRFLDSIQDTITLNLLPMHYSVYTSPASEATETEEAKSAVYAVLTKDPEGTLSVVAFKQEEELRRHTYRLERSNYRQADETQWKDRTAYTLDEIKPFVNQDMLQQKCAQLTKGLREGYYIFEELYIREWCANCRLFAAIRDGAAHYLVARYIEKPELVASEHLPGCMNLLVVQSAVEAARREHVGAKNMGIDTYVRYQHSFIHKVKDPISALDDPSFVDEHRTVYIITYRDRGINVITEFFLTDQKRSERLQELGFIKN